VSAVLAGTAGDASSGTVVAIVTAVNGLPLVTNKSNISGGLDLELMSLRRQVA